MEFALTKGRVPRGARADAETGTKMYLIKKVSGLRATYQVRLLLFRAIQEGRKLVLDVPESCALSTPLMALVREYPHNLEVTRS